MQKILIIQTSFIGDVILATALIEKLTHHFPDAQIDFLLRRGNESLLDNHPHIHQTLIWDKKKRKYSNLLGLLFAIRNQRYDLIVNLQRFFSTGFLTAFSGANQTVGFEKNPLAFFYSKKYPHQISAQGQPIHEVERNTQLVTELTDKRIFKPKLYPAPKDFEQFPTPNKYVCIAPFSVWKTKELPTSKWIALIDKLPDSLDIYLLGGPSEVTRCAALLAQVQHPNVHNYAGQLSFLASAALMSKAQMNYVNDSAPLHLASAMNAPVTAFFCSTLPQFGFTPLSEVSFIKEVTTDLPCRPCGLHGKRTCPEGHFKCGHEILL